MEEPQYLTKVEIKNIIENALDDDEISLSEYSVLLNALDGGDALIRSGMFAIIPNYFRD